MKKINILILCSILCFFYSCNGMLDGIQPYLDEGEKSYVGKLDSLKAFTGKNRIKIEGKMMYGVNQVKCVISYKDPITLEEKFKEFPIERTEPRETFEFMLEILTEGQYDFSIVTYDPKNNTSIPTEVSAYAYGELYQQALTNRILHSISPEQKEIVNESGQSERIWAAKLNWNISRGDGLVGCNLEYERQDGTLGSKYISVDETTTELDNFKANGILRYNSIYKPTTTSWENLTIGNGMKLWKLKMPMEVPASQNITMEQFSSKQHNGVRDIMTTERSGKHLLYQKESMKCVSK